MTRLWKLIFLLNCTCVSVCAQSTLQHRPAPAPEYVLGSGDQLNISVADMEGLPDRPITIDPSGYIDLPMIGRVDATGLTLTQLKEELAKKLSVYITKPEVAVNLASSGSQPVSVIGAVSNPGVHQLSGSKRLLEVIALSGELKPDAGPNVIVTRQARWGEIPGVKSRVDPTTGCYTATISLDSLMASRNPDENILMRPDDVVSIPRADLIYVVGDVNKAGGFQLTTHETVSLLQAISLAQGLGPNSAAGNARILRQEPGSDGPRKEVPVDVGKILAGKAPDVKLYANDVLFIPKSGMKQVASRAMEAAIGIGSGVLIYRQ